MSDGENNASNGLKEILEGGLPQALAGPAGKAISRLIGAATDIPAAWLEARAQQIRDQTEAKSQVSQKLAGLVAEKAVTDPALVERAMDGMVAKAYRTQVNKEAVAAIAAQDLLEDPPRQEVADIKEDWMNKFARYAEDASSDDLRTTFGKLLATEVRDPGKVAPSTLHFVTMLEPETARLIARVMPFASANGIAFLDAFDPRLHHLEIKMLEHAGFWSSGTTYTPKFSENGQFVEHCS